MLYLLFKGVVNDVKQSGGGEREEILIETLPERVVVFFLTRRERVVDNVEK